jgi:hypothetical protein
LLQSWHLLVVLGGLHALAHVTEGGLLLVLLREVSLVDLRAGLSIGFEHEVFEGFFNVGTLLSRFQDLRFILENIIFFDKSFFDGWNGGQAFVAFVVTTLGLG